MHPFYSKQTNKMKKVITIVVLFLSISINAQIQSKAEKNAKNVTNEVTEVLSLSEEDSKKVYDLALVRATKVAEFRAENVGMDEKEIRANIKPYAVAFNKALREIVGGDGMKTLSEYYKEKKAKK